MVFDYMLEITINIFIINNCDLIKSIINENSNKAWNNEREKEKERERERERERYEI